MTNEIARQGGSSLAIRPDQSFWSDQQRAALEMLKVEGTNAHLAVFFHQCQRTGLDPFKREIYMITRQGKPTIQTGIDGLYKIASRVCRESRETWGIAETYWCGDDGEWRDVWLPTTPPAAAKVVVERNGARFVTVALTREYKAAGPMWTKMPSRMIAKCAEALAIRKAFPEDTSGLYTTEEMQQADNGQQQPEHRQSSRTPQQAPSSNHDKAAAALGIVDKPAEPEGPRTLDDDTFDKSLLWIESATNIDELEKQKAKAANLIPAQGKVITDIIDVRLETLRGDTLDAEVVDEPAA